MSNDVVAFDPKCVLELIEKISKLVTSDTTQIGAADDGYVYDTIPDALSPMLHKISCVLRCKCSGGDMEASTAEIEKLLSSYEWDAKITIVLATFVVDYVQFNEVTKFYKNSYLGNLVAFLKQTPPVSNELKSKFTSIIDASIRVTRCIAELSNLPSKHISNDKEQMAVALKQIPNATRTMIKGVVACASRLNENILGGSECWNAGKRDITTLEEEITKMKNFFSEKLQQCRSFVEEKRETRHLKKLKEKFGMTAAHSAANNQKILKLIFKTTDGSLRLARPDNKQEVGVEVLKGKTVLLFISDNLEGYSYEISILTKFYEESRQKAADVQCEIVWLPIVENYVFDGSKAKTPWYSLLSALKPAVMRYVKEEWHYCKQPILVALDPRGKVANPNAFQMLSAWGHLAYPFTQSHVSRRMKWSLDLLVAGIDQPISEWIKEEKVICLFGGDDYEWIDSFSKKVRDVKIPANKIEMMYIGMNTTEEVSKVMKERHVSWADGFSDKFWRKIKDMVNSDTHHGATTTLGKVRDIHRLGESGQAWALISQGAGIATDEIAWGEADDIMKALTELQTNGDVKHDNFVVELNSCFAAHKPAASEHLCDKCKQPCEFLSGELNKLANERKEESSSKEIKEEPAPTAARKSPPPTGLTIERSRSNGGRGFRTGKVSPAVEPPSPRVSACRCCGAFGKTGKTRRRPPKSGKRVI